MTTTTSLKKLLYCVLIFGAIFASANAQYLRASNDTTTESLIDTCSGAVVPVQPFSIVYNKLDQLNWDHRSIAGAVQDYWGTYHTFLQAFDEDGYVYDYYSDDEDNDGEPNITLTTSCIHTAPWVIVALLELRKMPVWYHGLYHLPDRDGLIVYNNTDDARLALAVPAVHSIRDFVNSRPSEEDVVIEIDLGQHLPPDSGYNDHHFMIHFHRGQVQLYQSWVGRFTLIDWMTRAGSFEARYPMAQDTFLQHFETFLSPAQTPEEIKKRNEAIWSILGITEALTYSTEYGVEYPDDEVVYLLRKVWEVVLATHWPKN